MRLPLRFMGALAVLSLAFGCEWLAPLQPLPADASGNDAAAVDSTNDASSRADAVDTTGEAVPDILSDNAEPGSTDAPQDPPETVGDAGDDAAPPDERGDSDGTTVTCDPTAPFGDVLLVPGLNRDLGTEQAIHLSPDELTAYVSTGVSWVQAHLSVATRTSTTQPFGRLVPLAAPGP
jgi:hypothetical protein